MRYAYFNKTREFCFVEIRNKSFDEVSNGISAGVNLVFRLLNFVFLPLNFLRGEKHMFSPVGGTLMHILQRKA